jgi:hypothetical protein
MQSILTISDIRLAVPQGTVLFSTIIAPFFANFAISLVAPSRADKSLAAPAPRPLFLVGVFTARKIISASAMLLAESVEKKRFPSRIIASGGKDSEVAAGG